MSATGLNYVPQYIAHGFRCLLYVSSHQQQRVAESLQHVAHQLPAAQNFNDVLKKHANNSL